MLADIQDAYRRTRKPRDILWNRFVARPLAAGANWWDRATHESALRLLFWLKSLVPVVAVSCALLMVSRVRYSHVFNQWFRGRKSHAHIVQLVVGSAAVFLFRELAVPLIFCVFAFGAPLRAGWAVVARRRAAPPPPPPPADQATPAA